MHPDDAKKPLLAMKGSNEQSYPVLLCSVSAQELVIVVVLGVEAMPAAAARYWNGKHFTGFKSMPENEQPTLNQIASC